MTNLRCTARLLKRFGVEKPPDPSPGTNALGDWYANILFLREAHLLLCVSERGRLPVVASARGLRDFPGRFPGLVKDVLLAHGVSEGTAAAECSAMGTLALGPTRNRSLVGTLNEFGKLLKWSWDERPERSLLDWSLALAEVPCKPLDWGCPSDVVPEFLVRRRHLRVIPGGRA